MTAATAQRAIIIIPTYNEQGNIQKLLPLIESMRKKVKNWDIHVLVVDDSSPDGTANVVLDLQEKYDYLHLLVNKKKSGLGGAYLKGMAEAFGQLQADVVFEMDADLSHDPKKVPEFLAALDAGSDMVLGSRYVPGGSIPANWGLHRKFLSVVGNLTISVILTSNAVRDWTGGYRAIRKSVYDSVHKELESSEKFTGYTFQIGFLHKALRAGFKITEVPFHFIDRTEGESKLGTEYIINTLKFILMVRFLEITQSRIFKFLVVGVIGFIVNALFFNIFRSLALWSSLADLLGVARENVLLSDQSVGVVLSSEVAILSNYLLNNFWTFKDRKIKGILPHITKFLQFNFGSFGSVFIQYVVMQVGTIALGITTLFTLAGFSVTSDNIYLAIGVLIGMIWNFSIYNFVIWRK